MARPALDGLVGEFTGGDAGIQHSLNNLWRQEESVYGMETAAMRALGEYVSQALAASEDPE